MDSIEIRELTIFAHHGVLPEEHTLGQKFLISAKLYFDAQPAGRDDDLEQSIDYAKVCEEISSFFSSHTFLLIEAAAEHLANHLLLTFSRLRELSLTICKPWAPVHLPLKDISVRIHRQWHTAYLGLGSNLGDREQYLTQAIEAFREHPLCRTLLFSSFHETEPYGYTDQPAFLNACLRIDTLLSPTELLSFCQTLEQKAERVRTIHWGPRTLDVDLLFYDQLILWTKELVLPHPEIEKRSFVLEPLCEIDPYFVHPILNKRLIHLRDEL